MSSLRASLFSVLALCAAAGFAAACAAAAENQDPPQTPAQPGEPTETLILRKTRLANGSATLEPKTTPVRAAIPSPVAPGLRYLALGDSYTIGEKVADGERFPNQLAKRLRAKGVEMRSPQIIARTGWTTSDLSAAVEEAAPEGPFDLVTLLIGVNNQYRGLDLGDYRDEFGDLVDTAVELAGMDAGRVIVVSIPDWGVMPYARNFDRVLIGQQIDAFNKVNRQVAASKGVRYVTIVAQSRKAAEDADLAASDGLHPSAKQYQLWVEALLPQALAALGQ